MVQNRQILFDVSVEAYSNFVLEIIGDSGSGKTIRLNILAGTYSNRINVNRSMLLNGQNFINFLCLSICRGITYINSTFSVCEHLLFYKQSQLKTNRTTSQ
ncbi:hypothetical protein MXB_4393 [Myxobolus squamalis]|nr:hypothetical protein MXB_4393 [Myxobolus squamalis]